MITVETDNMITELTRDLASNHSNLSDDALWDKRSETANIYMLYAVKPLGPLADYRPHIVAIRERRRELLAALWLHLDQICGARYA